MDTTFASTLIAVLDEGSILRAARRMRVSPGAVALRIKALESEFGAALLTRVGRNMTATPAAARLLPALREIVDATSDLHRIVAGSETVGELRLGTIATASTGLLPPLLAELARSHRGLDLRIVPGTSIELRDRVASGELDAALIVAPPEPLRKAETFQPWVVEPLILIVPEDRTITDPLELIHRETFIRYDRRNWGGRLVDEWLRARGLKVRDQIEIDALDAIVTLVSVGLGVAIIPDWTGPRPEGSNVQKVALPPPEFTRRVGLFNLRSSPRLNLISLLTDVAESDVRFFDRNPG